MTKTIDETIAQLENIGQLDPNCLDCKAYFYPRLREGMQFHNIFAPRHQAMLTCKSGKHNHCTCDTCF